MNIEQIQKEYERIVGKLPPEKYAQTHVFQKVSLLRDTAVTYSDSTGKSLKSFWLLEHCSRTDSGTS